MLIETIAFRIYDSVNGTDDAFLVENTVTHQELIFQNRYTHGIEFTQTFDFQFAREKKEPKFITFGDIVDEALQNEELFPVIENGYGEIDDVDEMVGSF